LCFFSDLQSDSVEDRTWREQLQWPETSELIQLYYVISGLGADGNSSRSLAR